jgi:hypothetical protein
MSRQATEAAALLRAAELAWNDHRAQCPDCSSHARNRAMCRRGGILKDNRARALTASRAEAEADRQPHPDQKALF